MKQLPATLQQYGALILIAFGLFVLYRFRDFVFGTLVGGIAERVMRPSRKAQARARGEQDRLERISPDFRKLSDTVLEHSVRAERARPVIPSSRRLRPLGR